MASGNGVAKALRDAIGEEFVAEPASFLLDIAFAGRKRGGVERKAVGGGELAHEGFIGVGFGATEFVVDVKDRSREVQFVQSRQQEYRVGTAGDSYSDLRWVIAIATISANGFEDAVKHILILRAGFLLKGQDGILQCHMPNAA